MLSSKKPFLANPGLFEHHGEKQSILFPLGHYRRPERQPQDLRYRCIQRKLNWKCLLPQHQLPRGYTMAQIHDKILLQPISFFYQLPLSIWLNRLLWHQYHSLQIKPNLHYQQALSFFLPNPLLTQMGHSLGLFFFVAHLLRDRLLHYCNQGDSVHNHT